MDLSGEEKDFILQTAKKSILNGFGYNYRQENIFNFLDEEISSFVTLKSFGTQLRGCVGSIFPYRKLFDDIKENSYKSAFEDDRFSPILEEDINKDNNFYIEISILTYPKKLNFSSIKNLINYLEENKPGLIIKKGNYQSTFLPQVWYDLKDTESFLNHLVSKAGYDPNYYWLEPLSWEYFEYYSEIFGEKWNNIILS